ncbi:NAD(P)H-quinone dehydrogenase [Jatrophihabitans telluris]|uniref:NAD(P)H-quinone dehydrogenase n=1 Tax=Jatrophihabitans telluris TaxID=2038343 RepID=A0ABY4QVW2_9ACTN|nr:NAD(P)H-quinone dehydrogenase [Jatrophihabitans telluris]UQX87791.1 NAD(P)H-quinone dehydrogenase [Jatrophihabitans telluris]
MRRIAIIGGGPAGYEAATVAADLGAEVSLVESDGAGGACVLYDCVPSKTLIATSEKVTAFRDAPNLGVCSSSVSEVEVKLEVVNRRVRDLAASQSADIRERLVKQGVNVIAGRARFSSDQHGRTYRIEVAPDLAEGAAVESIEADVVLIATGGTPRVLPGAEPDGERILSWRDVYNLTTLPEHLIVVGSGVTGAEFASAYSEMGVPVTLVSSREKVLPGEDPDAADVIEKVFTERGGTLMKQARAASVLRHGDVVEVGLVDGRSVTGSHVLMCVGSVPNTAGLGLEHVGLATSQGGFVDVDRVSRTSVSGIYAAGDCTGVLLLASVAAMQGRIAMWHALGEAVQPLRLKTVAANVFTHPEIATVGIGHAAVTSGSVPARTVTLALSGNARAKMQGVTDGFVKLYCRPASGVVIGGAVVAPQASEQILPIATAVQLGLTVNELAAAFAVYPSLSGSITEAARQLTQHDDLD